MEIWESSLLFFLIFYIRPVESCPCDSTSPESRVRPLSPACQPGCVLPPSLSLHPSQPHQPSLHTASLQRDVFRLQVSPFIFLHKISNSSSRHTGKSSSAEYIWPFVSCPFQVQTSRLSFVTSVLPSIEPVAFPKHIMPVHTVMYGHSLTCVPFPPLPPASPQQPS